MVITPECKCLKKRILFMSGKVIDFDNGRLQATGLIDIPKDQGPSLFRLNGSLYPVNGMFQSAADLLSEDSLDLVIGEKPCGKVGLTRQLGAETVWVFNSATCITDTEILLNVITVVHAPATETIIIYKARGAQLLSISLVDAPSRKVAEMSAMDVIPAMHGALGPAGKASRFCHCYDLNDDLVPPVFNDIAQLDWNQLTGTTRVNADAVILFLQGTMTSARRALTTGRRDNRLIRIDGPRPA
jgi:hypothetical protein